MAGEVRAAECEAAGHTGFTATKQTQMDVPDLSLFLFGSVPYPSSGGARVLGGSSQLH